MATPTSSPQRRAIVEPLAQVDIEQPQREISPARRTSRSSPDLESPPIDPESVDLAFFSQSLHHAPHPQKAVDAARRILKPGGRIVILDLVRHNFEEARELYADRWLGFSEVEIDEYLRNAGFHNVEISIVHKEEQPPYFETLLRIGLK